MAKGDKRIILGSGKMYIGEFTDTIPDDATIEVDENILGLVQGGATLEYKPTYYEAKDDLGLVSKTIMTDEEATLKSGIMTVNGKTLEKLCATARVVDDTTKGIRTVKIGGTGNQDGKKYYIRFVHNDKVDGKARITIIGQNQAGFTFAFAKDKETIVDAEYKALPLDEDGTLIIFAEEIAKV